MPTFLITCATGRQGGSAARILLSKGYKVHALVRDPTAAPALALEALGATLFKGDLADVAAVTAATQGVTSVFLNPFPNFTNPNGEAEAAQTVVDAARAAGTVTSIVLSTVLRADRATDIDPARFPFLAMYYNSKAGAERVVRASGFAYTILRPGWLMHNYIGAGPSGWHFPEYAAQRLLTTTFPAGYRLDHLDAADVGRFAAAAFLTPEQFAGKEINLVNELLTFEQIAAQLSEAAGVGVTFRQRTQEETDALKATMPTIEMQLWAPKAPAVDLREYGIELTSFKEFLAREKDALRKTFVQ